MSEESFTPLSEAEKEPVTLSSKTKSLTIPVGESVFEGMPNQLEIGSKSFDRKGEAHVTVISFAKAKILKTILAERPELEAAINQISAGLDWVTIELLDDKFHIKQDKEITRQVGKKEKKRMLAEGKEPVNSVTETIHRESVIQMVDIPAVSELYERLKDLGIDLGEVPPTHITLYTSGDAGGIAVDSTSDLEALDPQRVETS